MPLFLFPKALSSIELEHFKSFSSNPVFKQSIISVICHMHAPAHTHTHTHRKSQISSTMHTHQTELSIFYSVGMGKIMIPRRTVEVKNPLHLNFRRQDDTLINSKSINWEPTKSQVRSWVTGMYAEWAQVAHLPRGVCGLMGRWQGNGQLHCNSGASFVEKVKGVVRTHGQEHLTRIWGAG